MPTAAELRDTVRELVCDELKAVSFRFLSRHADVAADVAKRALFDFANSAHGKDCAVIYCLSGWSQTKPAQHVVLLTPAASLDDVRKERLSVVTSVHVYGVCSAAPPAHSGDLSAFSAADALQTASFLAADVALSNCVRDNRHSGVRLADGPAPRRVTAGHGQTGRKPGAAPGATNDLAATVGPSFKGRPAPAADAAPGGAQAQPAAAKGKDAHKSGGGGGSGKGAIAGMFANAVPKAAKPAAAAPAPAPSPHHTGGGGGGGKGTARSTGRKAVPSRVIDDDSDDDDAAPEAPMPRFVAPPPAVAAGDDDVAMGDADAEEDDAAPKAGAKAGASPQAPAAAAAAPCNMAAVGGAGKKRKRVVRTIEDPDTGEEQTEVVWVDEDGEDVGEAAAGAGAAPEAKPPSAKKAAPATKATGGGKSKADPKPKGKGQMGLGSFFGKK